MRREPVACAREKRGGCFGPWRGELVSASLLLRREGCRGFSEPEEEKPSESRCSGRKAESNAMPKVLILSQGPAGVLLQCHVAELSCFWTKQERRASFQGRHIPCPGPRKGSESQSPGPGVNRPRARDPEGLWLLEAVVKKQGLSGDTVLRFSHSPVSQVPGQW